VLLRQGERASLTVETDENLLPYIGTVVEDGTLVLGTSSEAMNLRVRPTLLTFHLTLVTVTALRLAGVGDIRASSLDVGDLAIDLSGAGDVSVESLNAGGVVVCLGGVGNIELAGQADGQQVRISGSGTYHAADLCSESADVTVSGIGDATVWARATLQVRIPGTGSVKYYGSPDVRYRSGGLGRVISRGDHHSNAHPTPTNDDAAKRGSGAYPSLE
jgi:hypothetical protein